MNKINSILNRISIIAGLALVVSLNARAQSAPVVPPTFGVASLIQATNKPWNQTVVVEGFVTAVCPRSGKKAWLHDTNSEVAGNLRVEREGKSAVFEKEVVGKTIRVTGVLRELRIDAAYLDSWESRVKGSNTTVEKKDTCTDKCEANQTVDDALKRINALRAQITKSDKGYLSSIWVDGEQWQVVEGKGAK
jgi:hypothetical protein